MGYDSVEERINKMTEDAQNEEDKLEKEREEKQNELDVICILWVYRIGNKEKAVCSFWWSRRSWLIYMFSNYILLES